MTGVPAGGGVDRVVADSGSPIGRTNRAAESLGSFGASKSLESTQNTKRVSGPEKSQLRSQGGETNSREQLEQAVRELNDLVPPPRGIRFDLAEDDLVVQVVDLESDEVVRQIPPDRLSELRKALGEQAAGALLDDTA